MTAFPRTIIPFEVTSLEMPGPLISKSQSGRVNLRATQQVGRTWQERYLLNVRSVNGRALLAAVDNFWRNGTVFTIDHRDHLTPLGAGGGSPVVSASWTNLIDNSGYEIDAVGSTAYGGATIVRDTTQAYDGVASLKVTTVLNTFSGAVARMRAGTGIPASPTTAYAASVRVFGTGAAIGQTVRVQIDWYNGAAYISTTSGSAVALVSGWQTLPIATATSPGTTTLAFVNIICSTAAQPSFIFWMDLPQFETGSIGHPGISTGTAPGTSSTTGSTLYITGGPNSTANWLRAGDLIKVAGIAPIYEVTSDVTTEVNGVASIPINPPIFTGGAPAPGSVVTLTGVTMNACILEPPTYPTTSAIGADYGELRVSFSETL